MRKLYVKNRDGSFEELAAIIADRDLRTVAKTPIPDAIKKYNDLCTVKKCLHSQNAERLYFKIFTEFLKKKEILNIDEVQREHIDQFEIFLMSKMKAASVNRRMSPIKTMFSKCLEWKLIFENPCLGRKILKEQKNPYKPWTPDLMRRFISLCDGNWKNVFEFLWMSGARPMEVKNLRWTDIDYDEQKITLRCGKNAKIDRKFDMTPDLDRFLHGLKMNGPFVFADENGRQLSNDNLYQYCKKRMKKLGVVGYSVYGLRHGFATALGKAGASAFEIAAAMGHSSLDTTRRYVHVDKKTLIKKIKKANKY